MPATETALPTMSQAFESAKTQVAVETEKTAPADKGDTEEKETPPEKEDAAPDQVQESAGEEEAEILSKEEQAKLSPEHLKQYKKMQAAYTQKTQKLAAERKSVEERSKGLETYQELIDSWKKDPKGVIERLANEAGLKIALEQGTKAETTEAVDETVKELSNVFGPEAAAVIGPVFEKMILKRLGDLKKTEIEPLKEESRAIQMQGIVTETETELAAFSKLHPDWKQYEPKMLELGKKLMPAQGSNMTTQEYMGMLYNLATANATSARQTKEAVDRINKAAAASSTDAGVSADKVTTAAPKRPTFQEAFEAAKQGVRWEQ
jgi:hypothetical protein